MVVWNSVVVAVTSWCVGSNVELVLCSVCMEIVFDGSGELGCNSGVWCGGGVKVEMVLVWWW